MEWKILYSKDAKKFIDTQDIYNDIKEELKKFLLKIKGEAINVDVKKLEGAWKGYYRLRKGKIRIIFEINTSEKIMYIEKIDFRGDVYK